MGRVYDGIADPLHRFIAEQPMFFVATAPMSAAGRVNLSPQGMDSLLAEYQQTKNAVKIDGLPALGGNLT